MCQNIQEYAISNDLTFKNIKINELSNIIYLLTIKKTHIFILPIPVLFNL